MIYACHDEVQTDINVDAEGVAALVRALLSDAADLNLDEPTARAAEIWPKSFRRLRVRVGSGMVMVKREGECLSFEGDKDKLAILAGNLELLPDPTKVQGPHGKRHMHVEWFPEHFVLREDSEPLIMSFIE